MSDRELRTCPFGGRRVLVAAGRTDRPGGGLTVPPLEVIDPAQDPFAEGHEDRTPPEVDADRPAGSSPDGPAGARAWCPTATPSSAPMPRRPPRRRSPTSTARPPATGAHEVIIQSPKPVVSLSQLTADEVEGVVAMWQRRLRAHAEHRHAT